MAVETDNVNLENIRLPILITSQLTKERKERVSFNLTEFTMSDLENEIISKVDILSNQIEAFLRRADDEL